MAGRKNTAYGLVRRGFHVGSPLKRFDHSPFEYNSRLFTRHEPWLFLGLRCGYAATDSGLGYDRVPPVINSGCSQDSRRDALRNILRVVPYGIAYRRWK